MSDDPLVQQAWHRRDQTRQATPRNAVSIIGGVTTGGITDAEFAARLPLGVTGAFYPATQPVSAASLPLPSGASQDGTDITTPTAMPAGGAGIRGWLSAIWTKLNGSLAVTGTFFQATQPVSGTVTATGPLTDTQLRATAVPVSGTVTASGPLTDTQLRATAVPVSGTVTASGPLTDTQLRASAVPVSAASLPLPSGATTEATLGTLNGKVPDLTGTWGYEAGSLTAAGTVTGVGPCLGISVFANAVDSSFNINGGDTIPVRANAGKDIDCGAQVTAPVVNWVSGSIDVVITGLS